MDLSILQDIVPDLAGFLNVDPSTLLLYMTITGVAANIIGRLIPDDVGGFWGQFRDVCKIIGAYTPNRVTKGVSVNDVAASIVTKADPEITELAADKDALILSAVDETFAPQPVAQAFPGFKRVNEELNDEEDDSIGGSQPRT